MTRASIIATLSSGKFAAIYVHHDGYPGHMMKILCAHYSRQQDVDALLLLGDLSSLDASAGEPPAEHCFERPVQGYCVAYGRDRGEPDQHPCIASSAIEARMSIGRHEFNYFWDGMSWTWSSKVRKIDGLAYWRHTEKPATD